MGINMEVYPKGREDPKRMIKRFVRKCKKEGFLREVVERQRFTKPSEVKRLKRKKKRKVLKKLREEYEASMRD
jgi:ribosomal protein S21